MGKMVGPSAKKEDLPSPVSGSQAKVIELYERLLAAHGHLDWWPGDSPFEVMIGAILTQNTAWRNVEKAIGNLKAAGVLSPRAILTLPVGELAELVRPSGYYNQKAERLGILAGYFIERYGGRVSRMKRRGLFELREELLSLKGVGPETADSILLYALEKPIFVVDAYTRRLVVRHGFLPENSATYGEIQDFFMERLPPDVLLYNDFHAQIVRVGHDHCGPAPRCGGCPLEDCLE